MTELSEQITLYRVPAKHPTVKFGGKTPERLIPQKDKWFPYNAHKLAKSLISEGQHFDIVDAADYLGAGYYFTEDKNWKTPVVVTCHTPSFLADQMNSSTKTIKERLRHRLEKDSILQADALVVPSARLGTMLSTQTGRSLSDFRQIHYPFPLNSELNHAVSEVDVSKQFVLFSGRIERRKGVQTLLKAWSKSAFKDDYQLILAGRTTSHQPEFDTLIEELNLRDIELCGNKTREELYWLYQNASLVILPSEPFENFPYACIESLGMSAPTLVSNSGGMSEMIDDEENGWIFKMGNSDNLTANIDRILELSEEERQQTAQKGQQYVRKMLNPNKTTAKTLNLYQNLLKK
jgi:glycosyltransferase involved in cell wall biosynthesis